MGKLDEALACYEQIIDSIHSPYSKNLPVSMLLGEIRDLYIGKKDFKQALHYAQLAKENRLNRYEVPMHNLTLGKIYMYAHEVDSARSYLMRALQSPDHYVSTVAYKYLVALDVQMENYEEAYSTFQKSGDAFLNVQREIDYSIMSQQYKEEKLKNENNLLKLAKRDRELYLLWLSLFVVLACVVIYIFFSQERKKRMQKERLQKELLLKEEAKYLENENRLLKIESELSILREKESLLRESLFRRMTMATKIPSLDHSLKTEEELPDNKRIVLTEKEWEELILTVNDAYAGFAVRLREEYPVLTRKDIAFCCLVKIKVTMKDLSDIYCITKAGVSKKKTRMKKEKFGLSDDLLTLDLFLHHF